MNNSLVYDDVDAQRTRLEKMAHRIWRTPELALHEEESAHILIDRLREAGFDLEVGIGGMPTAFVASYGDSDPTVGILGEYDALPGLSQQVTAEREPLKADAPGHGCGHNLFGVAGVGAAIALKRAIERGDLVGTVEFYGCPAEEILVGKVLMAHDGVFDDLDAAITWHPSDLTTPRLSRTLALDSIRFTFDGVSAHAAASPESGRSALDAVELANTGMEYLREHIPESARVHYVITDGGEAPNVVPATATVWYYVRAPTRAEVDHISEWLTDIAEAAAAMTRTAVEQRYVTGCWSYLPNQTLTNVIWKTMQDLGNVGYTDEDRAFAGEIRDTVPDERIAARLEDVPEDHSDRIQEESLYDEPVPPFDEGDVGGGSSDIGDVSWLVPTGQFRATTWPVGTPGHSWQAVAASGGVGISGAVYAAKVLGGTACTLLSSPSVLETAQVELDESTGDRSYVSPLTGDTEPPFDVVLD